MAAGLTTVKYLFRNSADATRHRDVFKVLEDLMKVNLFQLDEEVETERHVWK